MPTHSIALIGDYDPDVVADRAIPLWFSNWRHAVPAFRSDQLEHRPSSVSYNARTKMQNARKWTAQMPFGGALLERVKIIRIWHENCPKEN
jgi:hypothetical protein